MASSTNGYASGSSAYTSASTLRNPSVGTGSDVSRPEPLRPAQNTLKAEQFEDEKRRIIASCFSKRDETGKLLQNYITHARVEEDAAYQSSPPPPGSNPEYRKPRIIILAVKSSGRVAMHKARENEDGSFQIGKTWGLEELQSIESFSNGLTKTPEEQQRANWAGALGFIITMSKPYYWQAKTPKEKEFFISSLVKVYNKFTGGKMPQLIGFDQPDLDAIHANLRPGSGSRQQQQQQQRPPVPPIPPLSAPQSDLSTLVPPSPTGSRMPSALAAPERPPYAQERRPSSNSSHSSSRFGPTPSMEFQPPSPAPQRQPPPPMGGPRPYQQRPSGGSPQPYPTPTSPRNGTPPLTKRPSREQGLRQPSPFNPHARSPGPPASSRLTPQGSRQALAQSPPPPSVSSPASTPLASPGPPREPPSAKSPNGNVVHPPPATSPSGVSLATTSRWRPEPSEGGRSTPDSYFTAPDGAGSTRSRHDGEGLRTNGQMQKIPERRRPPLQESVYSESSRSIRSETSRPRTPAGQVVEDEARASGASTPQAPGAFEPSAPSPAITSGEQKAAPEPALAPDGSADRQVNGTEQVEPSEPSKGPESQFRPGLGPMIGKKTDVANKFRKIANAHKAFVPRAGGAGERLAKQKDANEPETMTGVIPARSAARNLNQEEARPLTPEPSTQEKRLSPPALSIPQEQDHSQPSQSIQLTDSSGPKNPEDHVRAEAPPTDIPRPLAVSKAPKQGESRPRDSVKPKRKPNPFADAFANLNLDPAIGKDERAMAFEDQLNDFGWGRNFLAMNKVDAFQATMRKEIGKIEAGSWLGHSDEKDARVDDFERSLDKAIAAVDEMDGLLTLYSVELSTLVDDVSYIEAQSQGLQVQTANQKLLQHELENLVNTVSIDSPQLEPLQNASLGDARGLDAVEASLSLLYKALQKIDPAAIHRQNATQYSSATPGQGMRALQERREQYMSETNSFLHRFKLYLDPMFSAALGKARDSLQRSSTSSRASLSAHDAGRAELWKYGPLMLFVKDVNPLTWKDMLKIYRDRARGVYQDEIRDTITDWKKRSRNVGSDDHDILFTSLDKETEPTGGLASTAARKMTIKRSGTLARSLRQASHKDRTGSAMAKTHDASQLPYEVFAGVLADLVPLISTEQNFVTDFFHASGLESLDFVDAVNAERPANRQGTDLTASRMHDPDRAMADTVRQTIESIFAAWSIETQALLEWALGQHQLQGLGCLYTLERLRLDLADSNQEYLLKVLGQQYSWLSSKFTPFIDAQILAIEATKIKTTNKRRGVMGFVRVFPAFVSTTESMLQPADQTTNIVPSSTEQAWTPTAAPETRATVDAAYERLTTAMLKSLDSIAKEVPAAGQSSAGTEAEDKEKLNAEILLIENMHHLTTELSADQTLLRNGVLASCRRKAETSMLMHRERYLNAVIRRPLGRLLDFLESVEADRSNSGQATYSRSAFKKILSQYDAKTVRRDVEALKRRVEKHFGSEAGTDGDTQSTAGTAFTGASGGGHAHAKLVNEILGECEKRYMDALERTEATVRDVYAGELEIGFGRQDVGVAFRR